MYGLMFRTERLDMKRPSLHEAANASFAGLAGSIGESRHEQIQESALTLEQGGAIVRAWSLVHGFTMLLLDGRLADAEPMPPGNTVEMLLEAMLKGRSASHRALSQSAFKRKPVRDLIRDKRWSREGSRLRRGA